MDAELEVTDDQLIETSERRSSPRVRLETEVSLASDSQFFTGLTRNLSDGGIFVATYKRLPVGSRVMLNLALPDGDLLATGTVCWLRDAASGGAPGMGIGFDPLDETAFQRIDTFCQMREPLLHDED